ncbi:MAG TPA: SMP-30/gluconolactonase/LRE family protein [Nevskiaceae bacterium]|nr:SMP-30/gluconolactonase/LRE family protein [Nevskiaceae bacterium]
MAAEAAAASPLRRPDRDRTGPRRARWAGLALLGLLAAGLWLAGPGQPVPGQGWTPPANPEGSGVYTRNSRLAAIERLAAGEAPGPETVRVADGQLYAGLADRRMLRLELDGSRPTAISLAPGRPLGFARTLETGFVIAAGDQGLGYAIRSKRRGILAGEVQGEPLRAVTDVAVTAEGWVYYTEASRRHPTDQAYEALVGQAADGRLLRYHATQGGPSEVLLEGLRYPGALSLSADRQSLLISETGAYRLRRLWLAGPRAGQSEIWVEGLPGYPDGLSPRPGGGYWLALYAPRHWLIDRAAAHDGLRRLLLRLPSGLQPRPAQRAQVLALDEQGRVLESLEDRTASAYAPISSVVEHEGWLYLGSPSQDGIGRLRLSPAPAAAPAS